MKRSNSLGFLALILIGAGCTKQTPKTLISKWEQKMPATNVVERKLASSSQNLCMKDVFSVETLKEEVKELEKAFASAPKVKGYWKHINLNKLPVPQANFLKNFGGEIGDLKNPESIDYLGCEDLPCIFNRIYGKDDERPGYVHYLWYLKFGNMLALDNKIPDQKSQNPGEYGGKPLPFEAYLFTEKELYAFWRLSHMLQSPYTNLKYLKEIQRIPGAEKFEEEAYKKACGLASGGGWIQLTHECLALNENSDFGWFYQAVTHEMSHQIDFEQGRAVSANYRSHRPDYMEFTGMQIQEFVDDKGVTKREWVLAPGTKVVSGYAGTSPEENFAESLAVFRVDGDIAKKNLAENHFAFVSREYFQNRSFDQESLMKTWIRESTPEINKASFKAVLDCSKVTESPLNSFFKASDFSNPVLPGMLSCLSERAEELSSRLKAKTMIGEPEACVAITDQTMKGKWDHLVKESLVKSFEKNLQDLTNDKEYMARIQDFYSKISDKTIAKASYISCYKEPSEENCYKEELSNNIYEKISSLSLPEEQAKEMIQMYISFHSFSNTKSEVMASYQVFVSSHLEHVREETNRLWEGCASIPQNDAEAPSGTLFKVSGYIVSSFYNCLNANIPSAIKDTVRAFEVDGMKIQHAKEELLLTNEVRPHFINNLKEKLAKEQSRELKAAAELIRQDNGNVRRLLLSDFSWVKNVVDSNRVLRDCKKEGVKLFNMNPLFNLKFDLFQEYVEKNSCPGITATPEFNRWLESAESEMEEKVMTGLEEGLQELGSARVQKCLKQFPKDTIVNKIRFRKQREACLVDRWEEIEDQVVANAMKDPVAMKLNLNRESLRQKAEASRRKIQLRLIKENFN